MPTKRRITAMLLRRLRTMNDTKTEIPEGLRTAMKSGYSRKIKDRNRRRKQNESVKREEKELQYSVRLKYPT